MRNRDPVGAVGDATDIDTLAAQARREQAIKAAMLDAALDAIVSIDAAGLVIDFNRAAEEMFGHDSRFATGRSLSQLIIPPELRARHEAGMARYLATGEGPVLNRRTRLEAQHADGRRFPIEAAIVPIRVNGEVLFVGYLRDITEQVAAEARQRSRALVAREDAARKDALLAVIGHELRNPLAPITTALELLRIKGDDPATAKERAIIERQANHMRELLDDLLDVSRAGRGKLALERELVELGQIVRTATEIVRPKMDERCHALAIDVPREGLRVHVDPTRMVQVVTNLLTNAARYTPESGHIQVRGGARGEFATLEVIDNGQGIPPDALERIWDLYAQAAQRHETGQGGLGVGLTLVRQLVALHGGRASARSDGPGRGSTFIVELPLAREGEA